VAGSSPFLKASSLNRVCVKAQSWLDLDWSEGEFVLSWHGVVLLMRLVAGTRLAGLDGKRRRGVQRGVFFA
jgi:hypothetical protein